MLTYKTGTGVRVYNTPSLVPALSQINRIHIFRRYYFKINFIILQLLLKNTILL